MAHVSRAGNLEFIAGRRAQLLSHKTSSDFLERLADMLGSMSANCSCAPSCLKILAMCFAALGPTKQSLSWILGFLQEHIAVCS